MDKRKTIIVWMDGKQTKINTGKSDENIHYGSENNEQAATSEDEQVTDPIPTFVRQNTFEDELSIKTNIKQKNKMFKHIFIAALSAVLLGVGLGIFMLNMFTNIDTSAVGEEVDRNIETANGNSIDGVTADLSTFHLKSMEAFVLQGGIFSGESNAADFQEKYNQLGFSSMTWNRNGQYYLFVNLADSKEQLDAQKAIYKESNLETYAKKWTTAEKEIELTEAEYQWIQNFYKLWNNSVANIQDNQSFSTSEWNKWLQSFPENGEKLDQFYEKLKSRLADQSEVKESIELLEIWKLYESFVLN